MKSKNVTILVIVIAAMLVLLGPLAGQTWGYFVLGGGDEITVKSSHSWGELYDTSRAYIIEGGNVDYLYAYENSYVRLCGGVSYEYAGGSVTYLKAYDFSVADIGNYETWVDYLYAYNSSVVNISGGSGIPIHGGTVEYLQTWDFSVANISGGWVDHLDAYNSSTVNISHGKVYGLYAYNSSKVNISGETDSWFRVSDIWALNSSSVDISGGNVGPLRVYDHSVVSFYGQNFSVSDGLTLDGNRVLGTGVLYGEWFDGTQWGVDIRGNSPTATIWAIPEPATLLLLGLGAVMGRRRKIYY